jgi:tetratricopeptide (TPR) repeat protein
MTLDKLKVAARQHEQRDEWHAAIELYRQALAAAEQGDAPTDPALHNRIGDLEQKVGNDAAACEAWEHAAARYGEQGFFNNAIALCNKILRLDPSRYRTYLELARFQARKRVIYDVRQNLSIYHSHLKARGQGDEADAAVERFGAEFSSWKDLRGVVNELLGRESLDDAAQVRHGGEELPGGLVFLDTDRPAATAAAPTTSDQLVVEPTALGDVVQVDAGSLAGLEPTAGDMAVAPDALDGPSGMIEFERGAAAAEPGDAVAGLVTPTTGEQTTEGEAIHLDGLEATVMDVPPIELSPEVTLETGAGSGTSGIVFLETDAPPAGERGSDPLGDRATAHALLEHGDRAGGIAALERALDGYQREEQWSRAWRVATELIEAEPRDIGRHQTRVEIAARMRDTPLLCQSYQELGEALVANGSTDKAVAVFRRVLEIDETHAAARAALRQMAPEAASAETAEGFIDLGAMLIDDGPRTTRMRTETTAISEDEDETFREALAEFKRALDQNLPVEDHQTHYDLGVAFKEMGLLDEAIGEFQKALRSSEGRLRTSEALGQAFYEQGRPAVAEAVLRAVEKGEEGDAEKIGVLYWLGRAQEAQGKTRNALQCYERVLAVDVSFEDASERVTRLAAERDG